MQALKNIKSIYSHGHWRWNNETKQADTAAPALSLIGWTFVLASAFTLDALSYLCTIRIVNNRLGRFVFHVTAETDRKYYFKTSYYNVTALGYTVRYIIDNHSLESFLVLRFLHFGKMTTWEAQIRPPSPRYNTKDKNLGCMHWWHGVPHLKANFYLGLPPWKPQCHQRQIINLNAQTPISSYGEKLQATRKTTDDVILATAHHYVAARDTF